MEGRVSMKHEKMNLNIEDGNSPHCLKARVSLQLNDNKNMKNKVIFAVAFLLFVILISSFIFALDGGVKVLPESTNVNINETFIIDINISSSAEIYAADFSLGFNSSLIMALNVSEGNFLKKDGASTFVAVNKINNTAGYVQIGSTRFNTQTGVTGNGSLARIEFQAINNGISSLDFIKLALLDSNLSEVNIITSGGVVNVLDGNIITINLPNGEWYKSRKLLLNISLNEKAKELNYILNNKLKKLCVGCSFYNRLTSFAEGQNNLNVQAKTYNNLTFNKYVTFNIDSISPKISKTLPSKTGNGAFSVQYTEANVKEVKLFYGTDPFNLDNSKEFSCLSGIKVSCSDFADLSSYNGQYIYYRFLVKDDFATVYSKTTKTLVVF